MSDYTNVEGLIIDIQSDSSNAASELDSLISSLEKFKSSISNVKSVGTFTKNYNAFVTALKSTQSISNLSEISSFVDSVSKLNGIKFSGKTLASGITAIWQSVGGIDATTSSKIVELATSLQSLNAVSGLKISSTIGSNLAKVVEMSKTIEDRDIKALHDLVQAVIPLSALSGMDASGLKTAASSMKTFSSATRTASQRGRTFNTVMANLRVKTIAVYHALNKLAGVATEGLTAYGDYIETLNLFSVSMGKASESAYDFAVQAQDLLGIDITQWMKAQGVFMTLGKGFGIAEDRAAVMSQQLTQLGYDISSFYNINVADAMQKVQSAFSGELEPVRRLGYDLSQARLQAIALSLGIDENVSSMTQAEKASLRYYALLTQVTDAQGDLARTLDSPTNQLRILQAQMEQTRRSLGLLLIPIMNQVLPYLNALIRVLKIVIDEIAALFGYTLPTIDYSASGVNTVNNAVGALDDTLDDATGTAEKLKNTLASFDEINLITSKSGGSGAGAGASTTSGAGFNFDLPTYDFLGDATENKAKQIADDMMQHLRPALDFVKDSIVFIQQHTDEIKVLLGLIATTIIGVKLINALSSAATWFSTLNSSTQTLMKQTAGIALSIAGITISYAGGKDLAQGNTAQGIIEGVLGTSVAAIGGYLAFGPAGAIISAGISLAFMWYGYEQEKWEQTKERIENIAWAFDESKASVDEFSNAWSTFVSQFGNSDAINQSKTISETKRTIVDIVSGLNLLRTNYAIGKIDADSYVNAVTQSFTTLRDSVLQLLEETGSHLRTMFSGAMGVQLMAMGYTLDEFNAMWGTTESTVSEKVDSIMGDIEALKQAYQNGSISKEEYVAGLSELTGSLTGLGGIFDTTSTQVSDFNKVLDKGVSFTSLEEAVQLIKTIHSDYNSALSSLKEERAGFEASLQTAIQLSGDDATLRAYYENLLADLGTYYDGQEKLLSDSYSNTMATIENSAYGQLWDRAYQTEGLGATIDALSGDMFTLEKAFEDAYLGTQADRQETAFRKLMGIMGEYDKTVKANNGVLSLSTSSRNEYIQNMEVFARRFARLSSDYDSSTNSFKNSTKSFYDSTRGYQEQLLASITSNGNATRKELNKNVQAYTAYGNDISSTLSPIPDALRTKAKESLKVLTDKLPEFKGKGVDIVNGIRDSFKDPTGSIKNQLKSTMNSAKDISVTSFETKGKSLRDSIVKGYTTKVSESELTGGVKSQLEGLFNYSFGRSLGNDIGEGFGTGLTDQKSTIGNASDTLTGRMATSFNGFSGSLFDLMNEMGSGISSAWNSLTLTPGSAKFSRLAGSKWKLRGYATGGYPDSADFFYANENGVPEYIGSMGGKTAVANNDDIAKGISTAVYKAIKDTGIASDVKAISKKSNKVVFAPSEDAGRVMAQSVAMYNQTGGRY